jgi:diaminohydroxyphosphoribosylaminopyrimidine deaminase/5-amino-6-(5-phosphoribosylamino)uracil reductase
MNEHEKYMRQCLSLAVKGAGSVAPNPMVGCVIVHNGEVIGEGYHMQYGQAHAEVNAINSVKDQQLLKKATLYVNLEPCAHYGKTPPCVDLIIHHKIPYVVIGCIDSNSLVKGKGMEKLVSAGCDVKVGVLDEECRELNRRFFTFHEKKRPYIILKWAQSADRFIDAQRTIEEAGHATQISNETSRRLVHKWRSEEPAIMVGTNTALLDNPMLTVREHEGKNPLRIILDKQLKVPLNYHVFDGSAPTLVFTEMKEKRSEKADYVTVRFDNAMLKNVLAELYKRNIQSVIVEGGAQLIGSFAEQGLWDEARVFTSKRRLGTGVAAPAMSSEPLSTENIAGDELKIYRRATV